MNEATHNLARDIAIYLGWDYPPNQDGWSARIKNAVTQAELWVHIKHTRVVISAGFGDLYDYAPYDARGKHRITCAATKTIPQIGKDITRRIFPDFYRDLQIAKERHAAHVERMQGVASATLKFAAILNMAPPEVSEKEQARFHMGFVGEVRGDIQLDTKSVDIKLTDVPFHIAAMMFVPLGDYIKQHPKEPADADN